jgi:hypothetical protein
MQLLDDARLERDLLCARVDRVEHRPVAGDLCLGPVLRCCLVLDELDHAGMRRRHVLDRVGGLDALDPCDLDQRLQRVRVLQAEGALAALALVDRAQRRSSARHHPDLSLERPERVHADP